MENKMELSLNDIAELIKVSADETKKVLEVKIAENIKVSSDETKKTLETNIVASLEAKIDASTEELATMTQKHFLRIEENMEKGFKKVN
jgi:hypothetical protein